MHEHYELPLTRETVMEHLPHRDPMLFVDRVTALGEGSITIESDIRPDSVFFKGHFPDLPILPGVLIVETVAQAGALLVALSRGLDETKFLALTNVDELKVRKPVYPNETIRVDVEIVKIRGPFYKFSGRASRGEDTVATLKFTASQMELDQDA